MSSNLISVDEARTRVLERAVRATIAQRETVGLLEAAGRFLAREQRADLPWPTTDRSAMDGFALATAGQGAGVGASFAVVGEALAGHPFAAPLEPGQAVRIMTGGVVPHGADAVAMVEDTSGYQGSRVQLTAPVAAGANIRPLGSEVAAGELLLPAGRRIAAPEIGALAVLGVIDVPVVRRPRVAILSTGDEVVDAAATPALHQVRDSNSWALAAKAMECGALAERLGIVADESAALRAALERGLTADVLVTIGGVSQGTHDLVHGTLAELGVTPIFHGVALKPGKPTFFGTRTGPGSTCAVFGLPGNPASSCTTFDLFVVPWLHAICGGVAPAPVVARVGGEPFRSNRRDQAIPARLRESDDGALIAELARLRPSGDPFGLMDGWGYALVPGGAECTSLATVRVFPFPVAGGGARR